MIFFSVYLLLYHLRQFIYLARLTDIGEGLSPIQVTLDQAAHLMDALAFGHIKGGWDGCKADVAKKYEEAGYPEMAAFINA